MKRRWLSLSLLALGAIHFAHAAETPQHLDRIVAVVNDDIITSTEFSRAMQVTKMQMAARQIPVPAATALQKKVLDQLINQKVELQLAKQNGMIASEHEVNGAINQIAAENHVSAENLYRRVSQSGLSPQEYRDQIRDQLVLRKLQQQEVVSHINVTPDEIKNFMQSNAMQLNNAKEYHLEDILIPVSDTPSTEDVTKARERANEILAKVKQGQSFKSVAAAESGGSQALQGGDLGWRKVAEIPSAFVDEVVSMKVKGFAGPIQTANGFHILHLAEERANAKREVPSEQQVQRFLMERKFEEALLGWESKIRASAYISITPNKMTA